MTDVQNAYFQMFSAIRVACDEYNSHWAGMPVFADAYSALMTEVINKLPGAIAAQMAEPIGVTLHKQDARKLVEQKLEQLVNGIVAYALTSGNAALRTEANLPVYKINRAAGDALLGLVTCMVTLANSHIGALAPFGITPATITDMEAAASSFAGLMSKPRAARSERRIATKNLAALMAEGIAILKKMDDLMMLFRVSAPDFHAAWFNARKVIRPGFRTRALWVLVKDVQGNRLDKATFLVPGQKMKKSTSASGVCRANRMQEGRHEASIRKAGYQEKKFEFSIAKGETTRVEIVLDKA